MGAAADRRWSEERAAKVLALWKDGLSALQIVQQLRSDGDHGVTRNAVLGFVWRRGLTRADQPRLTKLHPARRRRAVEAKRVAAQPKPRPVVRRPAPTEGKITLQQLERGSCRWPFGEGPYTFCGEQRVGEYPYCAGHLQMAWSNG